MATSGATIRQAAVIPLRDGRVGLITSSNGQRWVIPKGHLEEEKTPAEVALQEAWEEAGLTGAIRPGPIGTYLYEKFGNRYHVLVFVLDVTDVADEGYPEAGQRQRAWVTPEAARERIHEPGLRELIRAATSGQQS